MTPEYSAELDLPTIFRGDTLNSFSIQLRNPDTGDLIEPIAVCAQVRDSRGKLVATLPTEIIGGVTTVGGLSSEVTSTIKPGRHRYDVQFTLVGGKVRTYLFGHLEVVEDVSQCP